jgi:hypothetical protein
MLLIECGVSESDPRLDWLLERRNLSSLLEPIFEILMMRATSPSSLAILLAMERAP